MQDEVTRQYEKFVRTVNDYSNFIVIMNRNRKIEILPLEKLEAVNVWFARSPEPYFILHVELFKSSPMGNPSNLSDKERFYIARNPVYYDLDWLYDGDFRDSNEIFFILY